MEEEKKETLKKESVKKEEVKKETKPKTKTKPKKDLTDTQVIEQLKAELKEELKKEMQEEQTKKETNFEEKAKETVEKILDTEDETKEHDEKDIETNKVMGILAYFGPLCLVPLLAAKDSKFANYHAKQGLNLFIIELIYGIISGIILSIATVPRVCNLWGDLTYECGYIKPWWIQLPVNLISILIGVIALIGIIYAAQGKAKELPIVNKIKIIK